MLLLRILLYSYNLCVGSNSHHVSGQLDGGTPRDDAKNYVITEQQHSQERSLVDRAHTHTKLVFEENISRMCFLSL